MSSGQIVRPGSATIHRILIVEDSADDAAKLKADLEKYGFRVDVAKDGGQAQASFVMHVPDLVLVDLVLPGESGFEVCERMKQTNDSVPVIVVTAIDLDDSRQLAARVGADAYIVKPWAKAQLVKTIDEVAEQQWTRRTTPKQTIDRVKFTCNNCEKRFKVSGSHRGKMLTCPKCGEPVRVPRHD